MDSDTIARPYLGTILACVAALIPFGGFASAVWIRWRRGQPSWLALLIAAGGLWWLIANTLASCFHSILEQPRGTGGFFLWLYTYSLLYVLPPAIRHCFILRPRTDKGAITKVSVNYLLLVPCLGLLWSSTIHTWQAEDLLALLLLLFYLVLIYGEVRPSRLPTGAKNERGSVAPAGEPNTSIQENLHGRTSLRASLRMAIVWSVLCIILALMARSYTGKAQFFLILGWKMFLPYPFIPMAVTEVNVLKASTEENHRG